MILSLIRSKSNPRLVAFTVHEPPNPAPTRLERAEELVFVRDGFHWGAALFTPVWLMLNRLWLELIGYIAILAVVIYVLATLDVVPQIIALLVLAFQIFVGYEAGTLKRASLARRGWSVIGTVTGRDAAECDRRFFEHWLANQPKDAEGSSSASAGDLRDIRWRNLFGPKT